MIAQWAMNRHGARNRSATLTTSVSRRPERHTRCCTVQTREVINGEPVIENLEFADYDCLADSCRDYVWLITQGAPYRAAWEQYQKDHKLAEFIAAVARVYATDLNYPHLAAAIAGQSNVAQATSAAHLELSSNATTHAVAVLRPIGGDDRSGGETGKRHS